ncbi:MAG: phosphonate ABC transporter ATP-binding protein [Dehalococcoidales bacterium]
MHTNDNPVPAFVLDGVTKTYPGTVALAPVSLEIAMGERVAIVGPSGAGKTTLLHLLGGVTQPDQGHVLIHGQPLAAFRYGRELANLVGIIHQQFDLVPQLSVMHNVLAGRLGQWSLLYSLVSLVSPRERSLALQALEKVGITDKAYERTLRLSGGEQQRVAVARLLVQDPRVILADEPVASLDPERAEDLLRLLSNSAIEQGKTLVASLHVVSLVMRHFSRVIGLRNGKLQFDLPAGEVTEEMLEHLYKVGSIEK